MFWERSRKSKIEQIKARHLKIVISTGQYFGEDVDIDSLECLVIAYPFAFKGLTQLAGSISTELLSQGDNWFSFHLHAASDLIALNSATHQFLRLVNTNLARSPKHFKSHVVVKNTELW